MLGVHQMGSGGGGGGWWDGGAKLVEWSKGVKWIGETGRRGGGRAAAGGREGGLEAQLELWID